MDARVRRRLQEEFIARRVEAHEARVYTLRFERESDGPHLLKKLANQAFIENSEATELGHLVELDEMRERVKLLETRSDDLKRMLRNTGTGLTPLVDGCIDLWTEQYPDQAHDRAGRSCYWKHKWGQCNTFGKQCARSCGLCHLGVRAGKGAGRNARRAASGRNARRMEGEAQSLATENRTGSAGRYARQYARRESEARSPKAVNRTGLRLAQLREHVRTEGEAVVGSVISTHPNPSAASALAR